MTTIRTDDTFLHCPDAERWRGVLARVNGHRATNLDTAVRPFDPVAAEDPGKVLFPEPDLTPVLPEIGDQRPAVGVMVEDALTKDPIVLAAQLAALALEKDCEIVVISENNLSGFERFGFRTERVAGNTEAERAACLDQIRAFWNLDIIL
ncbi:hypothetical protein [Actibacterium sp. 188UL27-1]|uniref:hypothetical protein n=1 Tax=Actibacterium sp. 188UL27-1 TaxID=2786961 RepID=UPI00195D19E4|nr:hypothetical protein [Actibacterium sp. 188UL27-1]MBM7069933.1 hypothetical protein [Actibacterium sp. 188UL27-1]